MWKNNGWHSRIIVHMINWEKNHFIPGKFICKAVTALSVKSLANVLIMKIDVRNKFFHDAPNDLPYNYWMECSSRLGRECIEETRLEQ